MSMPSDAGPTPPITPPGVYAAQQCASPLLRRFFFCLEELDMLIKQDLALSKIIDHPINASIYRDNFDDELVESVRQNGVLSPIVVCKHPGGSYVCLSGPQSWRG